MLGRSRVCPAVHSVPVKKPSPSLAKIGHASAVVRMIMKASSASTNTPLVVTAALNSGSANRPRDLPGSERWGARAAPVSALVPVTATSGPGRITRPDPVDRRQYPLLEGRVERDVPEG